MRSPLETKKQSSQCKKNLRELIFSREKKYVGAGMATGYVGSRDGAIVRALASHQCGLGSIPETGVICGSSLLLVLVLALTFFFQVFPYSFLKQKPTLQNSEKVQNR